MAEHKHGEMDITTQTDTFNGFMKFTSVSLIVIVAILIFMMIFAI